MRTSAISSTISGVYVASSGIPELKDRRTKTKMINDSRNEVAWAKSAHDERIVTIKGEAFISLRESCRLPSLRYHMS